MHLLYKDETCAVTHIFFYDNAALLGEQEAAPAAPKMDSAEVLQLAKERARQALSLERARQGTEYTDPRRSEYANF